ncbi:MAG: SDR family NAD(P)-dependent oxidoreductase [Chloroflexi bacterium]|nr:SDR family NAD(P)-dependent oxidoreductase [Chloroflexota bacterium]
MSKNGLSPAPLVLITGATSGLGLALAHHYQRTGARLVLVGRKPLAALDSALFTPATYCQSDLSQPDAALEIGEWLVQHDVQHLELLIHNAGLGYYGALATQPPTSIETLIQVNLKTPLALTHRLFPQLALGHGKVVFISSVAAALPVPDYAVYGATKAALDGLARNLRVELAGRIAVQVIHPGAIRTEMHAKSGIPAGQLSTERFPTAAQVAAQTVRAIATQRAEITLGASNRLVMFAGHWAGGLLETFASRRRA